MTYQAYCNGDLVAIVSKNKHKRWEITWVRRNYARERITSLDDAKTWIETVLHGKLVTWLEITAPK